MSYLGSEYQTSKPNLHLIMFLTLFHQSDINIGRCRISVKHGPKNQKGCKCRCIYERLEIVVDAVINDTAQGMQYALVVGSILKAKMLSERPQTLKSHALRSVISGYLCVVASQTMLLNSNQYGQILVQNL